MNIRMTTAVWLFLLIHGTLASATEPVSFRVAAWNMEGNGQASATFLKQQLAAKDGVDLWGLCEVRADRFETYLEGAAEGEGTEFQIIRGSTGGPKLRLAIIYDTSVLEPVGAPMELRAVALGSSLRAPLVQQFRGKRTGQKFFFMVNHLKCCGNGISKRKQQCKLINEWVAQQQLPVIMCGDLNIPYPIYEGSGSSRRGPAFDVLVEEGPFTWLEPEYLAKTQANDNFDTILDYIMVANIQPVIEQWSFDAHILKRDGDEPVGPGDPSGFRDDANSTDHRPVDVILTLGTQAIDSHPTETDRAALLRRIEALEETIRDLRTAVEALQ